MFAKKCLGLLTMAKGFYLQPATEPAWHSTCGGSVDYPRHSYSPFGGWFSVIQNGRPAGKLTIRDVYYSFASRSDYRATAGLQQFRLTSFPNAAFYQAYLICWNVSKSSGAKSCRSPSRISAIRVMLLPGLTLKTSTPSIVLGVSCHFKCTSRC